MFASGIVTLASNRFESWDDINRSCSCPPHVNVEMDSSKDEQRRQSAKAKPASLTPAADARLHFSHSHIDGNGTLACLALITLLQGVCAESTSNTSWEGLGRNVARRSVKEPP